MRPSDFMQRNPVKLDISRSKFDMSPRWTGTFNAYELVPILTYTDVLPGDTFKLSTSFVVRMSTPVAPVMDDLFLDVAFYFVPHELILSRSYMSPSTSDSNHSWKAFIGAQDSLLNMPVPDSDIQLPKMQINHSDYSVGGIADLMGMPDGITYPYLVNALAPLAFMAVWNENYRDPNTQNPGVFSISNGYCNITWSAAGLSSSSQSWSKATLPNVCRFHGYFGSALPWPQRNSESVTLPLGVTAPVIQGATRTVGNDEQPLQMLMSRDDDRTFSSAFYYAPGLLSDGSGYISGQAGAFASSEGSSAVHTYFTNLYADLANASAVSIATFRLAVQEQRWYEALARGGNRIDELTASLFGVMPKDAGGNQPEYLGGKRIPLQVSQVNTTANGGTDGTDVNTKVGQTGAFSLTADSDYYFTKSFDRWGSIIGVACVRYRDSFGGSLNRMFTRHNRFDFYFPQFANLGEQPVYKHELEVQANQNAGSYPVSDVFGYQEAWADYRTMPDIVAGLVRPGQSLDHWTYANNFSVSRDAVVTGSTSLANYLSANDAELAIDRTLQVGSSASGFQFLAQFQHSITAVRPMPLYSIPGLVDHH